MWIERLPSYASGVPVRDAADELTRWTPFVAAGAAVLIGAATIAQHLGTRHSGLDVLLVALAVSPWLVCMFRTPPMGVWVGIVVGAVSLLLLHAVSTDFGPFLLVLLAGTVGNAIPPRWSLPAAALAALPTVVLELTGRYTGAPIWAFATFFAWFFGFGFRSQLDTLQQLRDAQEHLAAQAAAEERQRLALEVHDLVAHTMSVTMLHITGARLALADGDLEEAIDGLTEAERSGRDAMTEIRRTVGLLTPAARTAAASAPATPPTDLRAVTKRYLDAGMCLDVQLDDRADSVDHRVSDGLARIAQEALANAAKHGGGGPVSLSVRWHDNDVELVVRNPSPHPPGPAGLGTPGMRSRAVAVGGCLDAGLDNGVWQVRAVLPAPS